MNEIYAIMMSWAVTFTGYPIPETHPDIAAVSHSYLVEQACGGRECKVMGWFLPGNTIYLDKRLNPKSSLYASAILLHEMVHYVQQQSGKLNARFSCETAIALEREAYAAQQEYLTRYGVYQPVGVSMHRSGCEPESALAARE
jgi:hypothetical protein